MSSENTDATVTVSEPSPAVQRRQEWMSVLARADVADLEKAWADIDDKPGYIILRAPESGMAMVRARTGGEGRQFNFGEMTMTRCVVKSDGGLQGHAYIAGRDKRRAVLAAVFDAMLQDPQSHSYVDEKLLSPVRNKLQDERVQTSRKVAATKVDFFTLVRGDD